MSYWKPKGCSSESLLAAREAGGEVLVPPSRLSLPQQRQSLPIAHLRRELLYCVETFQTTILIGETGCGKSTQVPQYLYEAGWAAGGRCIVCTQPRRIAAMSVSARTAQEMGCTLGEQVGYAIRFDSKCSENTSIKYCTDGILLRETMLDPLLTKYSVIIVDEAHERSLYTDVLLGLLKKIHRKRPDLRLVIASATLDAQELKDFFETHHNVAPSQTNDLSKDDNAKSRQQTESACILPVTGRNHPVDVLYLEEPCSNFVQMAVRVSIDIHQSLEEWGDILVFLPGSDDIENAMDLFDSLYHPTNTSNPDLFALPLHSSLPYAQQQLVFSATPRLRRKIVFATNIAETSVTIEGIRYVVDAGFAKIKYFDAAAGVDALLTCPISKASAAQRLGRAGRTQSGKCYRLMTDRDFESSLPDKSVPEMQRIDITWVVLQLKAIGIDDVLHFDFLSPPPVESMLFALEVLFSLGALNEKCQLTRLGFQMAEMPIEPRLAKCLLASLSDENCNKSRDNQREGLGTDQNMNARNAGAECTEELLSIAAMCSVDYPFISLKGRASDERKQQRLEAMGTFAHPDGDHMTLLNVFRGFASVLPFDAYSDKGVCKVNSKNSSVRSWCDQNFLSLKVLERALEIRTRLSGMLRTFCLKEGTSEKVRFGSCDGMPNESSLIRRCIIQGYFANAAQLGSGGRYWTVRGHVPVSVHPLSIISRFGSSPEWVLFHEVTHTDQNMFIREVSKIDPRWLVELAEHYYDVSKIRK